MDTMKLYLDLDMNIKLRKALACITSFIHAKTEAEGIREIEKAIDHLDGPKECPEGGGSEVGVGAQEEHEITAGTQPIEQRRALPVRERLE